MVEGGDEDGTVGRATGKVLETDDLTDALSDDEVEQELQSNIQASNSVNFGSGNATTRRRIPRGSDWYWIIRICNGRQKHMVPCVSAVG